MDSCKGIAYVEACAMVNLSSFLLLMNVTVHDLLKPWYNL